jgi:basic membrane protein A and related proteins
MVMPAAFLILRKCWMKKIYTLLVYILITALLLPACSPLSEPDCTLTEVFCVGLVTTNGGKVDDQALNQAAWEGIQQAEAQLNAKIDYIATNDWKDYDKNISAFGDAGYDAIVVVGYQLGEPTVNAAKQYPDLFFIGVDQAAPEAPLPNLAVLTFPTDEAGFLAGALAALMTKSKKIGGIFAADTFTYIWRLGEGYKAGALYINPEIQVSLVYHNEVGSDKTFDDPEWGATQAVTLIGTGADIIFAGGDRTASGAVIAAVEGGALAIGFDADQFNLLPEAQKGLLTSIVKRVTPDVFDLLKAVKSGEAPSGNVNGQVRYASFHALNSQISDEIKARIKEVQDTLADGSLTTNVPLVKP